MAMILLKPGNKSLGETVADLIEWKPNENSDDQKQTRRPTRILLWDFDSVSYSITVDEKDTDHMYLSMNVPFFHDIEDHGAGDVLDTTYKGLVEASPEEKYNITLKINFNDYTDEKSQKELIHKLEHFKPNVVGGVFDYYFKGLNDGKSLKAFTFDLRPDTQVYFVPGKDRVTVIFGIDFKHNTDKVIAKVFMQEFADARRDRALGSAPPVTFSAGPPRELRTFDVEETNGILGYVSFPILKSHVGSAAKRAKLVAALQSYRTYIQYHIKCSKSYFHSRMRKRCAELLKVLNRAKVKPPPSLEKAGKAKSAKKVSKSARGIH